MTRAYLVAAAAVLALALAVFFGRIHSSGLNAPSF